AHVRLALRLGASAICEKPLVLNPWNLDQLAALESESDGKVYTILQLRLLETLQRIREEVLEQSDVDNDVVLTYVTRRGRWYHVSWKGSLEKSGGLGTNIGIHLFDLMLWMFGSVKRSEVHLRDDDRMSGCLHLERARVRWYLSTREEDVPAERLVEGKPAFRSLTRNGDEIEFSGGFTDLHTESYRRILAGEGFGIDDARPSIDLVSKVRQDALTVSEPETAHPWAQR
ncbi:MAG: Gfo/Idh/MocA family oxidoreductase, partial [Myxococcota bacterium]